MRDGGVLYGVISSESEPDTESDERRFGDKGCALCTVSPLLLEREGGRSNREGLRVLSVVRTHEVAVGEAEGEGEGVLTLFKVRRKVERVGEQRRAEVVTVYDRAADGKSSAELKGCLLYTSPSPRDN